MSEINQSILKLMSELRPTWPIESLEHGINLEMARINFPRKKIDKIQAADIFFVVGGFLSDFTRISEHSLFEGYEDSIKSISIDSSLEEVEKLFRKSIEEIEVLWNNPESSIFSILPGVAKWMPEVPSQAFNNLLLLISNNARSRAIGRFRPQSVLWALYDYVLYALTGKRESNSLSSFSFGRYTDTAVKFSGTRRKINMSEIVLGGRSKERFAMYLALAAAVSLWIVQIDFATIDFANLTASTLPTFVSASTLIAIVLYELRIDILLDKLTEYMSKKCEHHSSMLAAALEDPLVQHALWSTKTGVVAGLAIIVGVLRYFEAIELWQVLLAISAGLITIIASLARSDIRKLPFRVAILSRYFGMRERVSRDYRKSKQRAVSIEKVLEFCKQIEETLNERRWNLFVEQVESLQAVFPKIPP